MTAVSEQSIITIDLTQADAIAQLLPYQPLLSSEKAWDSIQVEYHRQADVESLEHRFQQHLICIPITPPIELERVLNDERKTYEFGCGNLFIAPAGTLHRATSKGEAEFINLILDPTVFTKIAQNCRLPSRNFQIFILSFATLAIQSNVNHCLTQ